MTDSLSDTIIGLRRQLRERLDHLGYVEEQPGAFATGHVPHIAPYAYLCRWYTGIHRERRDAAESESGGPVHQDYWDLLTHTNGANFLGVSLHGVIGGLVDRSGTIIVGQPISLRYQNGVERADYIPRDHLGIGAINGEWSSQGHLYLASTGEIELYNARFDMVGARWRSLGEFLAEEIPRRFSLYDRSGHQIEGAKLLPGDTDHWEALAQKNDFERGSFRGFFKRVISNFRNK